jgi:hypothetical protein
MVWSKLTNPISGWSWYLLELEVVGADAICRVYAVGWDEQLTYFNQSDFDLHAAEVGAPNELDTTFTPCRLSEVKAQEQTVSAKFPLGQVVATPGALEALEAVRQNPLEFLRRHVQGDWGELDEHDRLVNEQALAHGGRLLSSYLLRNQQRLWIITEYDRSATTLLLPSEY